MGYYHVKYDKKTGRGLYAKKDIPANSIVIVNQAIKGPGGGSLVEKYAFDTGDGSAAIALGHISLVNHSKRPNAEVFYAEISHYPMVSLSTLKKIKKGQQIFIDYGYMPEKGSTCRKKKKRSNSKQVQGR